MLTLLNVYKSFIIFCGGILLTIPLFLLPEAAHADPEVTEMRSKGEISAEPHFVYKRIKRDIGGIKNGEAVDGTARETESEGELELKYGITDNFMVMIELENVFKEYEKATLRFGDEIEEESEKEKGIGDITIELVYRIFEENESRPTWVVGLGLKPQTAPAEEAIEKEIENGEIVEQGREGDAGQGNTNWYFRTAISKEVGNFVPFAEFKYTLVGDRDFVGGEIDKGNQLQLVLGTDYHLTDHLSLRSQFEYLHTGEETKRTATRVTTDSRDEITLRAEAIWEPVHGVEIRPFGGLVWEKDFNKKGPDADDDLTFKNNRGWFVGVIVGWHFNLFGE